MKKTLLTYIVISLFFFLSGCSSLSTTSEINQNKQIDTYDGWNTWDREGVYFRYPLDMIAAESETGDIVVKISNVSDITEKCSILFEERGELLNDKDFAYKNTSEYQNALKEIKQEGLTYNNSNLIKGLELETCGYAGENISVKPIGVEGINGVIFVKSIGQDIQNYFFQVLFVNQKDDVFMITLNPAYNLSANDFDLLLTDDFNSAYRQKLIGKNITQKLELDNLESNLEKIDKIINSIRINIDY